MKRICAFFLMTVAFAAGAEGICGHPDWKSANEYWIGLGGKSYLAAVIHRSCEWHGKITPKGSWIEKDDMGNPMLYIKWNDAVKAGIVEEKVRHKKFSKKCEPVIDFTYTKSGDPTYAWGILYPCGEPGQAEYGAPLNSGAPFGSEGFEFTSPDATGRSQLRDKATGKIFSCYNGNCS